MYPLLLEELHVIFRDEEDRLDDRALKEHLVGGGLGDHVLQHHLDVADLLGPAVEVDAALHGDGLRGLVDHALGLDQRAGRVEHHVNLAVFGHLDHELQDCPLDQLLTEVQGVRQPQDSPGDLRHLPGDRAGAVDEHVEWDIFGNVMYMVVLAYEEDLLVKNAADHRLRIDDLRREVHEAGLDFGNLLRPARQDEARLDTRLANALAHQALELQELGVAAVCHVPFPPSDTLGVRAAPHRLVCGGPPVDQGIGKAPVSCWS